MRKKSYCGMLLDIHRPQVVASATARVVQSSLALPVLGLALVFAGASVRAEALSFRGETDKNPLEYACGETMSFTFTLVDRSTKNAPVKGRTVAWTRTGDDGRTECGTAVSDAPVIVNTKIDRPGFVHIVIQAVDAEGKPVKGADKYDTSAGADVMRIAQTPPPPDFNSFWDRELARLRSVPMKPVLTPRDAKDPAVELYEFSVNTLPGEGPATGLVAWPKGAATNALPLKIDVPGYGYGTVPIHNGSVKKDGGAVVMCMTRHGEDPLGDNAYHENLWTNVLQGYGWRNNASRTGNDIYRMVIRDVRALQFAKTLFPWDGKSLTVSGPSMGGYRSIALAALDPDVTRCNPVYPWMCDVSGAPVQGRLGGWLPRWTDEFAYTDGVYLAMRVTCPVDTIFGLADYVCPPSGQMLLYRNLKGSVNVRASHGVGHGCGWGVNHPEFKFSKVAFVPGSDGRDTWGGSLKGPQQTATGRFRVASVSGATWVVDPEGRPYRNLSEDVRFDLAAPARRTPYVYRLAAESRKIGSDTRALRDPFDESFQVCLEWDLAGKRDLPHDPWCLGFLVDGDIDFGARHEALAERVLAAPDDQPAKAVLLKRLRAKDIAYDPAKGASSVPASELRAFTDELLGEYFRRTQAAVTKLDANLIYFGNRLAAPPPAWAVAAAKGRVAAFCGENLGNWKPPFATPVAASDTLHLPSPASAP